MKLFKLTLNRKLKWQKRRRRKAQTWMNLKKKKKTVVFLIITEVDHKGAGQAELRQLVALVPLPVLPRRLG